MALLGAFLACVRNSSGFALPTANRALLQKGGEANYFVPTPGKSWTSGTFGCVRTDGWQIHEGLDIKCVERDKQGEPKDKIMATADGTIAYLNEKAGLSNYGKYIVLRHQVDGLEVYSIYAHLSVIDPKLAIGTRVKTGEIIGIMGRTSNTKSRIAKERAHVHFEIVLVVNDRFATWFKSTHPGERNDHGAWNGHNLLGLDPRLVLLEQNSRKDQFSLLEFVRNQTELCRVFVRAANFPFLKRYSALIRKNPLAEREGVAGYELALNFNGIPYQIIPRAAREVSGAKKIQLLSVNEAEQSRNPCRRLIQKRRGQWELTSHGLDLLSLLTY